MAFFQWLIKACFESLLLSTNTKSRQFCSISLGRQLVLFTFKWFFLQTMTFFSQDLKILQSFFSLGCLQIVYTSGPITPCCLPDLDSSDFNLLSIHHKHHPTCVPIFTLCFCYITNLGGCTRKESQKSHLLVCCTAVYIFTGMLGFHRDIVHPTILCVHLYNARNRSSHWNDSHQYKSVLLYMFIYFTCIHIL